MPTVGRCPHPRFFGPPVQILIYMGGTVKVAETELKARIGFLYPVITHNISIFINATRESDSGQYMCSVNDDSPGDSKNIGIINLTVLGKAPPRTPASSDPTQRGATMSPGD